MLLAIDIPRIMPYPEVIVLYDACPYPTHPRIPPIRDAGPRDETRAQHMLGVIPRWRCHETRSYWYPVGTLMVLSGSWIEALIFVTSLRLLAC